MRARELASRVLDSIPGSPDFVEASQALASLAFCDDPEVSAAATRTMFGEIVESWSDSFDPGRCDAYIAFMCEVLYAPGSPVSRALVDLGYTGPMDLAERYGRVRSSSGIEPLSWKRIKRVVVLSRVTLGADIAVTSTIVRAALAAFPNAHVDLVAPEKNIALIGDGSRVRGCPISYGRGARLGNRLQAWAAVREQVSDSIGNLDTGEWILVDPDSRLTQLGLLPIVDDRCYQFFESRSAAIGSTEPLGSLAAQWCASNWKVDGHAIMPFAKVSDADRALASGLGALRHRRVATVSFGVGGRDSKRLGAGFEDGLLASLRARGYVTVLDYGAGKAEAMETAARFRRFAGSKLHRNEDQPTEFELAELITWKGSLAGFGQLITCSDVYIGYDSAAAHLAAAHAVPVISVFVGAPSDRFRMRWTPSGPGTVRVIPADGSGDNASILGRVGTALDEIESAPDAS